MKIPPEDTPVKDPQPSCDLKPWQATTATARSIILQFVLLRESELGTEKAIRLTVKLARQGNLPEHVARMIPEANAAIGKNGLRDLSATTLYRWRAAYKEGGLRALAPKPRMAPRRNPSLPPRWCRLLLPLYLSPARPSLAQAVRELRQSAPPTTRIPSYCTIKQYIRQHRHLVEDRYPSPPSEPQP